MKVLHLIDHMGLGGEQRVVQDLAFMHGPEVEPVAWSLRSHELPGVTERMAAAGVPYRTFSLSASTPLAALDLRRALRDTRPDVVHLHLEYSTLVGALATLSLAPPRPLLVASVANDPYRQSRFHRWAGARLAPRMDLHITHSRGIRDSVLRAYAGRPRRVEVVSLGIDLGRFRRDLADPARIAEYRRGAGRVVGAIGRLVPQKAMHVLIDAAPALLAADPALRVLIVGDGPLRAELEAQAARLGVAHAVRFAGYQEDVVSAYAAMDVFVLPSRDEGFGLVFLEAMAVGVPVVGTRVIGSEDAVDDGVTGLLVPYADSAALAAAVRGILESPELARRLRETAAERVRRVYSREQCAARVEGLYRELLEARSGGPAAPTLQPVSRR
ncbi:MAG TPA: glycosyltransferase [Gemmatimonadales bacterium]|nr:glycosyltransferase [Gemmatimonadales bacterium]